jgi:uncharacterized protein YkwD
MKNRLAILLFLLLANQHAFSQSPNLATKIFNLINEARTNPAAFLKAHRDDIADIEPKYISILEKAKPIPKIGWDPGLVAMAKSKVESHVLNPSYTGKNTLCSFAHGSTSGDLEDDEPLEYVCSTYNNVHDEDNIFFGAYANKDTTSYAFIFGATCESKKITYTYDKKIDTSAVDYAKLNTGKNEKYLSSAEIKMIAEINLVRAYPKVYATIIAKYLSDKSKSSGGLDKNEYEAGMELIDDLNKLTPLSILQPKQCIFDAAKKHGIDCEKRGFFDHEGSDGSYPWDRILKQCPELDNGNENGCGNADAGVRAPLISLLIDEGISSRGHRYNIIDKTWKYIGCYRYTDKKYGYYWIQNFAP